MQAVSATKKVPPGPKPRAVGDAMVAPANPTKLNPHEAAPVPARVDTESWATEPYTTLLGTPSLTLLLPRSPIAMAPLASPAATTPEGLEKVARAPMPLEKIPVVEALPAREVVVQGPRGSKGAACWEGENVREGEGLGDVPLLLLPVAEGQLRSLITAPPNRFCQVSAMNTPEKEGSMARPKGEEKLRGEPTAKAGPSTSALAPVPRVVAAKVRKESMVRVWERPPEMYREAPSGDTASPMGLPKSV